MFQSCGSQVAGFCNCSGLNGLVVVKWKPIAAVSDQQRRQRRQQHLAVAREGVRGTAPASTPLSANPTMTMEITQ